MLICNCSQLMLEAWLEDEESYLKDDLLLLYRSAFRCVEKGAVLWSSATLDFCY